MEDALTLGVLLALGIVCFALGFLSAGLYERRRSLWWRWHHHRDRISAETLRRLRQQDRADGDRAPRW